MSLDERRRNGKGKITQSRKRAKAQSRIRFGPDYLFDGSFVLLEDVFNVTVAIEGCFEDDTTLLTVVDFVLLAELPELIWAVRCSFGKVA
jgi:hypothetical protein